MSKETKHAPGPWWPIYNGYFWEIQTRRDNDPIDIEPYPYGAGIASTLLDRYEKRTSGKEIEKANAILISSAPDLIDALKKILEQVDLSADNIMTRILNIEEIAHEAIEKATNQNIQP